MTDKELIEEASLYDPKTGLMGEPGSQTRTLCELVPRLAAALTAHQWRPIETAPREGKVLVGFPGVYAVIGSQDMFGEWVEEDASDCAGLSPCYPQPTHWKPVTPPEVEK